MSLNFPHFEDDIQLQLSPLVEVVCQVRFPVILSIPETKPARFQDVIRRRFPEFEVEDSVLFQLNVSAGEPLPLANQRVANRVYKFIHRGRGSTVTLAEDFYAVSSSKYSVWEEFAEDLELVNNAVNAIYKPSYATRIGLRYVNLLDPEKLGLDSLNEVVDLLRPELVSIYGAEVWGEPAEIGVQMVFDDNGCRLGFRMAKRDLNDRSVWQLDFDYFQESTEGLELDGLIERCHGFHTTIYDAFRWSIADGKIEVFKPVRKAEVGQ